jgi:hypothetical protein
MAVAGREFSAREITRRAETEAQIAAAYEAEIIRLEGAKMGLFITRIAAGLPVRRAADRHCEKVLAALATKDGQESLQILLAQKSHA